MIHHNSAFHNLRPNFLSKNVDMKIFLIFATKNGNGGEKRRKLNKVSKLYGLQKRRNHDYFTSHQFDRSNLIKIREKTIFYNC